MKTCREVFEGQAQIAMYNLARGRDGHYRLKDLRVKWLEFREGWRACGEQAVELYDEWAADSVGPNLKMQLKALAKGDGDGESQEQKS